MLGTSDKADSSPENAKIGQLELFTFFAYEKQWNSTVLNVRRGEQTYETRKEMFILLNKGSRNQERCDEGLYNHQKAPAWLNYRTFRSLRLYSSRGGASFHPRVGIENEHTDSFSSASFIPLSEAGSQKPVFFLRHVSASGSDMVKPRSACDFSR